MKRLSGILLLAVAVNLGSPRPAAAQFSAFMEWLASLDPGGFYVGGPHFDFRCYGDAKDFEQTKPGQEGKCTVFHRPEQSRYVFGVEGGFGQGTRNLDPNPGGKITVFSAAGTFAWNFHPRLQLDATAGAMWFVDPYAKPSKAYAQVALGIFLLKGVSAMPRPLREMQVRPGARVFLGEFHPEDFGAPAGNGFGRFETKFTVLVHFPF